VDFFVTDSASSFFSKPSNKSLAFTLIYIDLVVSNSIAGFSLFNLFGSGVGCCPISKMTWEVEGFYSVKAVQNFIHRPYQQINNSPCKLAGGLCTCTFSGSCGVSSTSQCRYIERFLSAKQML
jgi:hypothetical protein